MCAGHRGRQAVGTGHVLSSRVGHIERERLGGIFVEMASQRLEAQKGFRCEVRVCQQNREVKPGGGG